MNLEKIKIIAITENTEEITIRKESIDKLANAQHSMKGAVLRNHHISIQNNTKMLDITITRQK